MANEKLTALSALTDPVSTDLLYAVDDPSGTPISKKIDIGVLMQTNVAITEVSVTGGTTLTSTAYGKQHACSGTSADYTVVLPAAASHAGEFIGFRMSTALTKAVTLDGNSGETINGSTTRLMWAGETAVIMSDGSNWFKISGISIPMGCGMSLITTPQTIGASSVVKINVNSTDFDNSGFMGDTGNSRINVKRAGTYIVSGCVTYTSNASIAQRTMTMFYKGGTLFCTAEGYMGTGTYSAPFATTPSTCASADQIDLRAYQTSANGNMDIFAGSGRQTQLNVLEIVGW